MKFFGQFFDHAPISFSKSVTIERALTVQVSFFVFVFLSAKWLRKEIGKKLSLSILVSIKNFHDRLFAILIGIGIAITIFVWHRDRDLDQDFLS